jgi:hypothetical protein
MRWIIRRRKGEGGKGERESTLLDKFGHLRSKICLLGDCRAAIGSAPGLEKKRGRRSREPAGCP